MTTAFTFASTIHYHDSEWGSKDRMGIIIKDLGNGALKIARTTTTQARRNLAPTSDSRRLMPDGMGKGNSLRERCDLMATKAGITEISIAAIIPNPDDDGALIRGRLGKADAWWLEDQLSG